MRKLNSRTFWQRFKHFQEPCLFTRTFKDLEILEKWRTFNDQQELCTWTPFPQANQQRQSTEEKNHPPVSSFLDASTDSRGKICCTHYASSLTPAWHMSECQEALSRSQQWREQ